MVSKSIKGGMLVQKSKGSYIFIDVEATLIYGKQHVIEIGAIKWLPDGTTESFSQLIRPYKFKRINPHIEKLTGITTMDLLNARSFKQVINDFMKWCNVGTMVTFGEFDRKVLEDEFKRNHLDVDFLYPIVDFQQKYMIEYQMKEQPSLSKLLDQYHITAEVKHRALADAYSLYQIFKEVNGEQLIERQRTNDFGLLLSEFRQTDECYELYLSYVSGIVNSSSIESVSIQSIERQLSFEIKEMQRETAEGEIETIEQTIIHSDQEIKKFLKNVVNQLQSRVLMTRSGLKQMAKINRLHDVVFPKVESMSLQQLLKNEDAVNEFTINHLTIEGYEKKLHYLLQKYENVIVEEFHKRDLFIKTKIQV